MFCMTKQEALDFIAGMEDDKFPILMDCWDVEDVHTNYQNEDEEPLLTDEQAAEVLATLEHRCNSELGVTNARVFGVCASKFPICGDCDNLKENCECVHGTPDGEFDHDEFERYLVVGAEGMGLEDEE